MHAVIAPTTENDMTKATPTSETNETELSFGTKALRRDGAQKTGTRRRGASG